MAPEGSVAKITGKEGLRFEGTAKVYDSEELMMAGLNRKEITKGTTTQTGLSVLKLSMSTPHRDGVKSLISRILVLPSNLFLSSSAPFI